MSTICLYDGTVYTGITVLNKSAVIIRDGKIEDVVSNARLKKKNLPPDTQMFYLHGATVCAGFIDTHIHGINGYDTSDGKIDSILKMSESLVEYGVTGFCPTLYPQNNEDFIKCIKAIVGAIGQESGARILGMHLEGPFVSRDKQGVLNPNYMREVDLHLMERFIEAAEGHISIMTVAPELKNMRELALYCIKRNIILSAGHTNASYENMLEGFQAGITHTTHFFNAMRRQHHRDPGVVGAVLIHPEVSCEVICDGYHLHPAILKLLMRVKPIDRIVMVTDSLKPTGQKSGPLLANNEEVFLEDGVFKRKSDHAIAGSALTMINGVKTLSELGFPMENILRMANSNPATVLLRNQQIGNLIPGRDADIVVFDKEFQIQMVFVKGVIKKLFE